MLILLPWRMKIVLIDIEICISLKIDNRIICFCITINPKHSFVDISIFFPSREFVE